MKTATLYIYQTVTSSRAISGPPKCHSLDGCENPQAPGIPLCNDCAADVRSELGIVDFEVQS